MQEGTAIYSLKRPYIWGVTSGAVLFLVYSVILTVSNSLKHAVEELLLYWYWIFPLIGGFGLQAGLYSYIKASLKAKRTSGVASASVVTAGGVSTTSMVACCAHHVTDLLPLVGLSAAVVFLNKFQSIFFLIGIVSNTVGVILMLKIIQQHGLYSQQGRILPLLMKIQMKKALYVSILAGTLIIIVTLYKKISLYGGV
ncbi:MAG TPA: hypothetical protein ENK09_09535 [Nitrospirae bacterium]|nr:hypothetical protein [Nitrospirota bacterium]